MAVQARPTESEAFNHILVTTSAIGLRAIKMLGLAASALSKLLIMTLHARHDHQNSDGAQSVFVIDRVAGAIRATHPDFRYQPIAAPEDNWAMAGESNGYRATLARHLLTPGLISSLPGTAGLPPFYLFFDELP